MNRHTATRVCRAAIIILLGTFLGQTVKGQSLHTVMEPRERVFPVVGAGVTVLRRDTSGHYYILAKPANVISVYDSAGNPIGRIPNEKSQGASIRYAADFDLSPEGQIFVADRGANAVEVFGADGSPVARIAVVAPTSVVALTGGQFAVTSLTSKRLVQILDEHGKLVRSFGDPADLDADTTGKQPLTDWGRIVGSPSQEIYFAFTSLPDPMMRKYDRYGYVGYEASVPRGFFQKAGSGPADRVEVRLNLAHLSLSEESAGWISLGSSGDFKFGGGVGTGISRMFGSGGGFGRAGLPSGAGQGGFAGAPGGSGLGGRSIGGTFAGEFNDDGAQFQFGAANLSSMGGGRRGRNAAFANADNFDQPAPQGSALQFFGAGNNSANQDSGSYVPSNSQVLSFTGADSGNQGPTSAETDAGADINQDLGFSAGTLFNSVAFQTQGTSALIGGGLGGGIRFGHPNFGGFGGGPGHGGGPSGSGPGSGEHFGDGQHFHGRFGSQSDFTATLRVNLGDLGGASTDKPAITATAVDPSTGELWAGIGDTLIHFSKEGNPEEVYYLTMKGGGALKPTALLIEPERFLIAADPWGIFEFPRPK